MREVARIVVINAVGAADSRDYVAAPIEYPKGMAVFERAQPPLLERDVRFDVKRRRVGIAVPRSGRLSRGRILRRFGQRSSSLQVAAAELKNDPRAPRGSTVP